MNTASSPPRFRTPYGDGGYGLGSDLWLGGSNEHRQFARFGPMLAPATSDDVDEPRVLVVGEFTEIHPKAF